MNELLVIFNILVFPGFLTLVLIALIMHWVDRKLIALFQDRIGPPLFQPVADIIKLFSKEDIIPQGTNPNLATLLPLVSFASVLTAAFYAPLAIQITPSFQGDFILVMFLLSLPSLLYFLAGWVTQGVYSLIGGNRSLLQYFSYEVLFLLALSGTAIASGSWSIADIRTAQLRASPYIIPQFFAFLLAVSGLIGKLKREPYDIPKAKSEVIAGPLTEFSGKKFALWYLTIQLQTLVGISFLVHCYFTGFWEPGGVVGFFIFLFLVLSLQFLLSAISSIYARLRIDQLIHLNWHILIPLSLLHNIFILLT